MQYRATLNTTNTGATPILDRASVTLRRGHRPGTQHRNREPFAVRAEDEPDRHGDAERLQRPGWRPARPTATQWHRNSTQIAGATTNTLNLAVGNGDRGDAIRAVVYVTDGRGAASDPAAAKLTVSGTPRSSAAPCR